MTIRHRNKSEHRTQPRPVGAKNPPSPPQLLQIEKPIYGGSFLAHVDGKAVFVPLALPGEQVRARVTEEKRGYATAEIDDVVERAPERIAPACRHFGMCGGCSYQYASYTKQLQMKQAILRETLERGGIHAPDKIAVLAAASDAQSWNYRNRIRLAVNINGEVGYRGRKSNAVIPIAECPIAAPLLMRAAHEVVAVARELTPALRLTEVALFCDAAEQQMLISVFGSASDKKRFGAFAHELARRVGETKGVELVESGQDDDGPYASRTVAQWGEKSIRYRAADFDYRVDQGAFFQVNRWLVDALVDRVITGQTGRTAWDLFAGVGLFAQQLATKFERVIAVESAPSSVAALKENMGSMGMAVHGSTFNFLRRADKAERPDLIVVDPPRTGLGPEVTSLLAQTGAPALTYVSCDPATLTRDLRGLLAAGYAIESVTLADLFPQTHHLETVVRLGRS
jgi:23S rRNA (uracil1939-C5)-methyltransferase